MLFFPQKIVVSSKNIQAERSSEATCHLLDKNLREMSLCLIKLDWESGQGTLSNEDNSCFKRLFLNAIVKATVWNSRRRRLGLASKVVH